MVFGTFSASRIVAVLISTLEKLSKVTGSFEGKNTGEVFKYKEINKYNIPVAGDNTFHINVKGDKGSHFIMSGTYLSEEPWVVFDKAMSH